MFPNSETESETGSAAEVPAGNGDGAGTSETGSIEGRSFEATVTLPANLHARPAGKLAQAAGRFRGTSIRLGYGGRSIDPAGVLAVMSLGATAGSAVTVRAEGPDAEQAVRVLTEVLSQAE